MTISKFDPEDSSFAKSISRLKFISSEIAPNYQFTDGVRGLQAMLSSSESQQRAIAEIEAWFTNLAGTTNLYFTDSARGGLTLLLKNLDLPLNSEVLIQAFSCIVVPNSVLQASLKPVICDIEDKTFNLDLETLEQQITAQTRVLVIQHNFGQTLNMNKIMSLCQKFNLILIEDCAHSLGAKYEYQGKTYQVGQLGQASIFSFGRDKIISSTVGGVAIINLHSPLSANPEFAKDWGYKLSQDYAELLEMPAIKIRQAIWYILLSVFLIKPFYHLILGKLVAKMAVTWKLTGEIYTPAETSVKIENFPPIYKYSPKLGIILVGQLNKLDLYNRHRQQLAQFYAARLDLNYNENYVYLRFPIHLQQLTHSNNLELNAKIYTQIKLLLRHNGIFMGTWYTKLFVGSKEENPYKLDLSKVPVASRLILQQVINLPTNIGTSPEDAEKIVDLIKEIISEFRSTKTPEA